MIKLLAVSVVLVTAASAAVAGPRWVSGPDRAFNCTHYLAGDVSYRHPAQVKPGDPMVLTLPVDKVMKFQLAATPATKGGKVTFAVDGAPPGAKLAGTRFEWKVAGSPGQHFTIGFDAIEGAARTRWTVIVNIADAKLFTAWSAGMGSVWPDCDIYPDPSYQVLDLDGDGKDDVIYGVFDGDDGTIERHIMLQRGAMKFTEAGHCIKCSPTPEVAVDGSHLLIYQDDCCCILSVAVDRLDGDQYKNVRSWQLPGSCASDEQLVTTVTFERDAKQRITGMVQENRRGDIVRYVWRDKQLVEAAAKH